MYIYWKSEQMNTNQEPRVDFWSSVRNTRTGSYLSFIRDRKCGLDDLGILFSLFKILINELNSFQCTRAHVSSEGFTSQPMASSWSQVRLLNQDQQLHQGVSCFIWKCSPTWLYKISEFIPQSSLVRLQRKSRSVPSRMIKRAFCPSPNLSM